jgi:hypothetical protein
MRTNMAPPGEMHVRHSTIEEPHEAFALECQPVLFTAVLLSTAGCMHAAQFLHTIGGGSRGGGACSHSENGTRSGAAPSQSFKSDEEASNGEDRSGRNAAAWQP